MSRAEDIHTHTHTPTAAGSSCSGKDAHAEVDIEDATQAGSAMVGRVGLMLQNTSPCWSAETVGDTSWSTTMNLL